MKKNSPSFLSSFASMRFPPVPGTMSTGSWARAHDNNKTLIRAFMARNEQNGKSFFL